MTSSRLQYIREDDGNYGRVWQKGGREREQSKMIGRKIKEQEKNANENKKKKRSKEHKSASSLNSFLRIMRIYIYDVCQLRTCNTCISYPHCLIKRNRIE